MNIKQYSDNVIETIKVNEQIELINKELKEIRWFNFLSAVCLSILLINLSNNIVNNTPANDNITVNRTLGN